MNQVSHYSTATRFIFPPPFTTGMEPLRVNFNNGNPVIVPQDQLQNKRGRYYFDEAITLNEGEIFISPFDLNVEHGAIEQPQKPMIRFATPVFDQWAGSVG